MENFPENKYDKDIIDVDEIEGTDIKINPDFYIHTALLKMQESLHNPKMEDGLIQYQIFIEHIEILSKAAKMLSKDYETEVEKYKQTDDYIKSPQYKNLRLAHVKLGLILKEVFSKKVATEAIKI
jgi:hypothetical protein